MYTLYLRIIFFSDTKWKVIKHVAKALSLSYKLCLNVRLDSLLCTFTFISILSRTTIKALFLYFNLFGVMLGSISYPCTLLILPRHLRSPHVYSGIRVVRSLVFYVVLYRSLFVLLSFFVWPLHCPSFFDFRIHNLSHIHLHLYYPFLLINQCFSLNDCNINGSDNTFWWLLPELCLFLYVKDSLNWLSMCLHQHMGLYSDFNWWWVTFGTMLKF
jgi:hypothetical protein